MLKLACIQYYTADSNLILKVLQRRRDLHRRGSLHWSSFSLCTCCEPATAYDWCQLYGRLSLQPATL